MMRSMFRRGLPVSALMLPALLLSLGAASAEAASLPAHAEIRAGRCVEPAVFRRLVASRYHVEFTQVIATDIDRDGDIDVVATTDHTFTVWVNDGAGHLTSQRQPRGPAIDGRAPATTWRERDERTDPSTNDGASAPSIVIARAHAPPDPARVTDGLAVIVRFFSRSRSSAPRAPPSSL